MFVIGVCRGLGRLLSVACGRYRYVFFYRRVPVAWVVASFCLNSLSIFSSRLFSSFLVYSLISYSNIFEHGRLHVECVGLFFISVCRGLGGLLPVACGMYRYVFYRCVSGAWEIAPLCLQSLSIFSSRLFSSFLVYSLISYSSIF